MYLINIFEGYFEQLFIAYFYRPKDNFIGLIKTYVSAYPYF